MEVGYFLLGTKGFWKCVEVMYLCLEVDPPVEVERTFMCHMEVGADRTLWKSKVEK